MKHICVIGIGGVGRAHIIAACRYLRDVEGGAITLVDFPDTVDWFEVKEITNQWGDINDRITPSKNISFHRVSCYNFDPKAIGADLYIIATPDDMHHHYLRELDNLSDVAVLCEKPLVSEDLVDGASVLNLQNVHLGCEWMYHPLVQTMRQMLADDAKFVGIEFTHSHPPMTAFWDNKHQVFDLGSHCVALQQYLTGATGIVDYSTTTDRMTTVGFTKPDSFLQFGYEKEASCEVHLHYRKDEHQNKILFVEWIPMERGDLFYRQLMYIMDGGRPLLTRDNLIEGMKVLKQIKLTP